MDALAYERAAAAAALFANDLDEVLDGFLIGELQPESDLDFVAVLDGPPEVIDAAFAHRQRPTEQTIAALATLSDNALAFAAYALESGLALPVGSP